MNIPPSEAALMSLYEYEEILYHWNEAHRMDDDADAPDPQIAMAILEKANSDPRLIH
jgi:hypothetical protein